MVTSPKKAPEKNPTPNVMGQSSKARVQTGEGKLRSEKKSLKATKKAPAQEK